MTSAPSPAAIAVYVLGVALLILIGGMVYLAAIEHTIPDVLELLAVGSLTGIAGIITPTPHG